MRPFLAPTIWKRSRRFNVDIRSQSKSHEGSLSISLFRTATKILLAFISRSAILQHESRPLKKRCFGRSSSLLIFSAKDVCTINFNLQLPFYLYLYLQPREKCFFFSDVGHKQGRCENTRKGLKETENSLLHSISGLQINVRLGAFIQSQI